MNTMICDMYETDEAAHAAALQYFDADEALVEIPTGPPVMYKTDEAAYMAALRYFDADEVTHD